MGKEVVDYGSVIGDDTGDPLHVAGAKIDAGARAFTVIDKDLTAPPGSESLGDTYIVGGSATGDWSTHDGKIAVFGLDSTWQFISPAEGMLAYLQDEDAGYRYSGSAWVGLKATIADVRSAASSDKHISPDLLETASAFVALTDGANISFDWDVGINRSVTLGGNRTLDNPTNGQPGTWRTVIVTQDGTGDRTLAFGTNYEFPGGAAPTLTTAAAAVDVLSILCVTASLFYVFTAQDMG
jgi:hypothetical protein